MKNYLLAAILIASLVVVGFKSPPGSADVRVTELLPKPRTTRQFVELLNTGRRSINIAKFRLETANGQKYTFPAGTWVKSGQYLAFYTDATGLDLSQRCDYLKLFNKHNQLINQSPQYCQPPSGQAWAKHTKTWQWSKPTPNQANDDPLW